MSNEERGLPPVLPRSPQFLAHSHRFFTPLARLLVAASLD